MKLKQALVIGLTSAILAIPAIAAESATDLTSVPTAASADKATPVKPAQKEAVHHKKGHKKCLTAETLDAKQKENVKLNELNTVNPSDTAKN